ncbi:MAG: hypothetical protein QM726_19595 [Chitinophagaceae bacterium]
MKSILFLILMMGQGTFLTAQKTVRKISVPKLKGDLNCFYKRKYSPIQRTYFYPFNIKGSIELVSFRYHKRNCPVEPGALLTDSLIERKVLSLTEIDSLTDILYNNFYKQRPNYLSLTQCFSPRNAILFYDKAGRLKENILLCFHCSRHEESSDKVNFGSDCIQKLEKIRQFFISVGVHFGTDIENNFYAGEDVYE